MGQRLEGIDLNSDLGEGFGRWSFGEDAGLLEVITSANVACGFHAGDPSIMRKVCADAAERGITIGAHVGYRDLAGFGRRLIEVDPAQLHDDVVYQIAALDAFARLAGSSVRYVKPHGALYNAILTNTEQADAVVQAIQDYASNLAVLGMPGSEFLRLAGKAQLRTFTEVFADRNYTPNGELLPRHLPHATIEDLDAVRRRCVRVASEGLIEAIDGSTFPARPDSVCVHGDSPGAAGIARVVRQAMSEAGATVRPFA